MPSEKGSVERMVNASGFLSTASADGLQIVRSAPIATLGNASQLWRSVPLATLMRPAGGQRCVCITMHH